ncbi:hypothetical protein J8281_08010 [Aquimarina sp. U1-2]|uniref:hypothetical protein n=1 Tax=Aquimarina sp. U1-2 TaxID=2823141 RepID=UPI001AECFEB9|nr:hypothetical protein [Aquimarina sp. U1-2]MBP2832134.1 hypothetical protein [Aquimarina sp. U1-2]
MKIVILLLVICSLNLNTEDIGMEQIRASYRVCSTSKENAEQFYDLTKKALRNEAAIYKGYHGAALALKASFSWNPISKLSYFNKGKKMIEHAIKLDPDNVELRMIRVSIQSNVPKVIGYYENIEEDKNFILDNVSTITSSSLKEYIQGFIEYSEVFSKS